MRKHLYFAISLNIFIISNFSYAKRLSLQELIDQTKVGGTLKLSGTYNENIHIKKSIIIDGQNKTTIKGLGKKSVIYVEADKITLKNLKITNSGSSHDQLDSGIYSTASYGKFLNNIIFDTLFGLNLKNSHHNLIKNNDISSKDFTLGMRGDGIKIWSSNNNIIRNNKMHDSRDMVLWYSDGNQVIDNISWNNRYALHFMYSGANIVRGNKFSNNAVCIFLMYSHHSILENNELSFSTGGTGMGIGMKEVDHMTIKNNKIVYNSTGIYLDQSPYKPDEYNMITGNIISNNNVGVTIHSTLYNNVFKGNSFLNNLEDVLVHSNGTADQNIWSGNYWSEYEGFDRDKDGYGDSPYINKRYVDQIWINDTWGKFFIGSPVLSVLNFLSRLAPLSKPVLVLKDEKPIFNKNSKVRTSHENIKFKYSELSIDQELLDEDQLDKEENI